jgi:ABC-type multidrug transport system fused ATPase/permease subunit
MVHEIPHYCALYYRYAKSKFLALIVISVAGGIVDLIGISLLVPILNLSLNQNSDDKISQYFEYLFDYLGVTTNIETLLIIIIFIFMAKGSLVFFQKYWSWIITITLRRNIQHQIIESTQHVNYETFSQISSGTLNNIIVKETSNFASSFTEFSRMLVSLTYIMSYATASALLKPEISLIMILGAGIVHFGLKTLAKRSRVISQIVTEGYGRLSSRIIEMLQHYIYLKSSNAINYKVLKIKSDIDQMRDREKRMLSYAAVITSITEPIAVLALSILVFYHVSIHGAPLTQILVVGLLLYRIFNQILLLQGQWQRFNTNIGSINIIEKTLQTLKDNQEGAGQAEVSYLQFPIRLENVSFSHADKSILDSINLRVEENTITGIVGVSGSGKTTLFYIITGLLKANTGAILMNNTNYCDLDLCSLRSHIGYVTQEPALFEGTIRDNLSVMGISPKDEEIRRAFSEASCTELLNILDSPIGENGKNLSGGQKQRLSIARELLKNPVFMIFDEATSALDAYADEAIRNTIEKMRGLRTVLIITHRLYSVKNCDVIHVLKNGRLSESGTYDELSRNVSSEFTRMLSKQ